MVSSNPPQRTCFHRPVSYEIFGNSVQAIRRLHLRPSSPRPLFRRWGSRGPGPHGSSGRPTEPPLGSWTQSKVSKPRSTIVGLWGVLPVGPCPGAGVGGGSKGRRQSLGLPASACRPLCPATGGRAGRTKEGEPWQMVVAGGASGDGRVEA